MVSVAKLRADYEGKVADIRESIQKPARAFAQTRAVANQKRLNTDALVNADIHRAKNPLLAGIFQSATTYNRTWSPPNTLPPMARTQRLGTLKSLVIASQEYMVSRWPDEKRKRRFAALNDLIASALVELSTYGAKDAAFPFLSGPPGDQASWLPSMASAGRPGGEESQAFQDWQSSLPTKLKEWQDAKPTHASGPRQNKPMSFVDWLDSKKSDKKPTTSTGTLPKPGLSSSVYLENGLVKTTLGGDLHATTNDSTYGGGPGWAYWLSCTGIPQEWRDFPRTLGTSSAQFLFSCSVDDPVQDGDHAYLCSKTKLVAAGGEWVVDHGRVVAVRQNDAAASGHRISEADLARFFRSLGGVSKDTLVEPVVGRQPRFFKLGDYLQNGLRAKPVSSVVVCETLPAWARSRFGR
jgi:hypothetical protein